MHADHPVRAARRGGQPDHGDGRGVGREDGALAGDDRVEAGEDIDLEVLVLGHRLDHQVVVVQGGQLVDDGDQGRGGLPS